MDDGMWMVCWHVIHNPPHLVSLGVIFSSSAGAAAESGAVVAAEEY